MMAGIGYLCIRAMQLNHYSWLTAVNPFSPSLLLFRDGVAPYRTLEQSYSSISSAQKGG